MTHLEIAQIMRLHAKSLFAEAAGHNPPNPTATAVLLAQYRALNRTADQLVADHFAKAERDAKDAACSIDHAGLKTPKCPACGNPK